MYDEHVTVLHIMETHTHVKRTTGEHRGYKELLTSISTLAGVIGLI